MDASTILANPEIISLEGFISESNVITVITHSTQKHPRCPSCHEPSKSFHSHYRRTVADLPWHDIAVRMQLNSRKFRCRNELCRQKIFCERLPAVVNTYARKSCRLDGALTWLAFALGGEAGARTTERLRMKTSGDTLLRIIRRTISQQSSLPFNNEPKVIGVDNWAWRQGCTYGTIIVDLERRKVIDLLPDREASTLTDWLLARPSIETVARDRSVTYHNGIMMGRPYATQIADRWHLLNNLGDGLEKMIERLLRKRKCDSSVRTTEIHQSDQKRSRAFEPIEDWQWNRLLQKSYQEMKRNACRERLLPHLPALPKVEDNQQRKSLPAPDSDLIENKRLRLKLDPRILSGLCFRKSKLPEDELRMLCDARAQWEEFDRAYPLAEEFVKIIRGQSSMKLSLWIVRAFDSKVKELKSFANALQKDFLAVKEATTSIAVFSCL
jgi:transposase